MVEIVIEYYENGNVMYEIPFVDGKLHGVAKEYDENGELKTGGKNEKTN